MFSDLDSKLNCLFSAKAIFSDSQLLGTTKQTERATNESSKYPPKSITNYAQVEIYTVHNECQTTTISHTQGTHQPAPHTGMYCRTGPKQRPVPDT